MAHVGSDWKCPTHGTARVVPAGTAKATGKPYPAFTVCDTATCKEKPPRGSKKPAPVYVAPQPDEFIGMTPDDDDDGTPFPAEDEGDFDSIASYEKEK